MTHEVVQAGPGGDYCVVVGESVLEHPVVNAPRLSLERKEFGGYTEGDANTTIFLDHTSF